VNTRADTPIEHDASRRRRMHEPASASMSLNMTPMIDVVFLLLVYFVLGSNFAERERGLHADVPESIGASAPEDPFELPERPLVLRVRSRSEGALDFSVGADDPLLGPLSPGPGLKASLERSLEELYDADQELVIEPMRGARWEHALEVYNAATGAGFRRVRFAAPVGGGS